ncbi:type VI secretion system baseplate subunit TssF [Martelella alba]|uniref:Type VI secretion system baseplate subunit TssF n=1 Tax=Martelella alba TaxID=2590451 RepID=A0ABY2SGR0_9HYPH|nr:type VI secretion system baseplate subunit TssF [Martelella alba]TKI04337.1 type VI secretion system baseplate subunit TssF [Martelella alba]
MDGRLLAYYQRELTWLREMGAEFALRHPDTAGNLGMSGDDIADPYVERLMEGCAFLTSRIQMKMDDEFPQITRQLLEMLYPHTLAGIPAMAIVQLQPDNLKGDISQGFPVPRGTLFDYRDAKNPGIDCRYRTAHDVMLQPLVIEQVSLGGIPAELRRSAPNHGGIVSALRIELRSIDNVALERMQCDQLTFYLAGDDMQAGQLMELLIQHTQDIYCRIVDDPALSLSLNASALRHEGFAGDQALLPRDPRHLDSYRLAREYFHFPARFRFFSVSGLQPLLSRGGKHRRWEIFLLLGKAVPELERRIDNAHLALHCTPVINLFPRSVERVVLNARQTDYPLVADKLRPLDYEIHSVLSLYGSGYHGYQQEFRPMYEVRHADDTNNRAWYTLRREPYLWRGVAGPSGPHAGYDGSEVFVSLADEAHPPRHDDLRYLNADVLCSNRHLPLQPGHGHSGELTARDSLPIRRARMIHGPSSPCPAPAQGRECWQLINLLFADISSLLNGTDDKGVDTLRRLLQLLAGQAGHIASPPIGALLECRRQPCYRLLAPPAMYARGVHIQLTLDEQAFSGAGAWLLGSVLARLFDQLAAVNSFADTTLVSPQRGIIGHWPGHTTLERSL